MLPFDIANIIKQFIPPHKQVELQDRIVDSLTKAFPHWQSVIQTFRSDAAFRDALSKALERAVQKFASNYEDKEIVDAVTQNSRFWDKPGVQSTLQEIVARPSSYLQSERDTLFHSFADVLSALERERVDHAVRFFLRCLTEEVITIPQLAPIYQTQFQLASLEKSYELVELNRVHNQMMKALVDNVAQNQGLLPAPAEPILAKSHDNLPPQYGEILGREKDIARVLEGLKLRWPLISIEGMGGMGKTILAMQIARSCLPGPAAALDPPFEYVVWVSAKDQPEQTLWLNEVLDTIGRVLGDSSIVKMSSEQLTQKQIEVDQLLRSHRTLIIVDNFETIKDPALKAWIQP